MTSQMSTALRLTDLSREDILPRITKASDRTKDDLSSRSNDDETGNRSSCECLRKLTEQLCILNDKERQHGDIPLESILSHASVILNMLESAVDCQECRRDSKALLLMMTLLQTVFNWAMLEQRHCDDKSNIQPVVFGKWTISAEENNLEKGAPINMIWVRSTSAVDKFRQRITGMVNNEASPYQVMDVATLEFVLQRLVFSIMEVEHRMRANSTLV